MPLEIASVQSGSLAETSGILPGDRILSINGNEIRDFLDLQFHASDSFLRIELLRKNKRKVVAVHRTWDQGLGLEPAPHKCRKCTNDCIFCFVDQMKPDLRDSLYIKDDDYRLSFTFGNYITLTNLTEKDLNRISDLNLSPLYVSVHTTNPRLHRKMLRYYHDFNIKKILRDLSDRNILLHTQIVIVPGWNDGENLQRTLDDLNSEELKVLSVGIVPVGITRFRKSLTRIEPVSPQLALDILNLSMDYPRTYCSDEIFLLAQAPLPPTEYYNDYPQLENGIGMIRLLLENWKMNRTAFLDQAKSITGRLNFVTSVLPSDHIELIVAAINEEIPGKAAVTIVENKFFGSLVTVCGLLTGEDIINRIKAADEEILVLSSGVFNEDGLTLDGMDLKGILTRTGKKALLVREDFSDWEFYG